MTTIIINIIMMITMITVTPIMTVIVIRRNISYSAEVNKQESLPRNFLR